jgi:hypothetical protein
LLAALLLLAVKLMQGVGAFGAALLSVAAIPALVFVGALGSCAIAGRRARMLPVAIGLPARFGLLATAPHIRGGRAHRRKRPAAR